MARINLKKDLDIPRGRRENNGFELFPKSDYYINLVGFDNVHGREIIQRVEVRSEVTSLGVFNLGDLKATEEGTDSSTELENEAEYEAYLAEFAVLEGVLNTLQAEYEVLIVELSAIEDELSIKSGILIEAEAVLSVKREEEAIAAEDLEAGDITQEEYNAIKADLDSAQISRNEAKDNVDADLVLRRDKKTEAKDKNKEVRDARKNLHDLEKVKPIPIKNNKYEDAVNYIDAEGNITDAGIFAVGKIPINGSTLAAYIEKPNGGAKP